MDIPASNSAGRFDEILRLIGELNYTWTNTESLLVHLIAGLAAVDKETATVIFLTLGASRARISLVERLAKLDRVESERRDAVLSAMRALLKGQKVRNHYNHCLYAFDSDNQPAMTINLRISESRDSIRLDGSRRLDARTLEEFYASLEQIKSTNQQIWGIIRKYEFPT
ncbi:hypothetical protein U0C82_16785 [Fulvimarina sp. 2208YS6-2-32]|uniref:Uncharacterized protein n=1 Tax=Fulvimarina uroteuthidis TaxID=3098149 RepID=A0ABU5I7F3_9HYPH|nr:hypothetical protein [Fulvimarina sp. 2208YS6-2-32]MDY8110799.1 hypothetical protein [Fulvimarina sp. 2208YS6-2-32]